MSEPLRAPFPAFGGKRAIASLVWERFGVVDNYVEPFVNSAAVGLAAPFVPAMETWNDRNGFIANFWRAVQTDPEAVARWADWPVNEADLHTRHAWLVRQEDDFTARLMGDPEWHDARVAGWWLWGICQWIGSGWCSGEGPWTVNADGMLVNSSAGMGINRQLPHLGNAGMGINRQLPHLGNAGMGINRKLPHLGNAGMGINRKLPHLGNAGRGINRQLPHLGNAGMGINRKLPHLGNAGRGINRQLPHLGAGRGINRKIPHLGSAGRGEVEGACAEWTAHLRDMMAALSDRLRRVRVCCGDWARVCGPTPTDRLGLTAVFLDPPYQMDGRDNVYDNHDAHADGDNSEVFYDVVRWAISHTDNRQMRVAVCGYYEDDLFPDTWECVRWKAHGGYGSQGNGRGRANVHREAVWFSPSCLKPAQQMDLFSLMEVPV